MVDQGNGGVGSGMGLIPSDPDPRDFQLSELLAALPLAALPPAYTVPNRGPVLNQGMTPQCVAYSSSGLKAWQDRIDQGTFFDFNEPLFFSQIGGGPGGAALRSAMARLLGYGYPVVTSGDAANHKIKAYYAAAVDALSLKTAIAAFGPVLLGMHWFSSWSSPRAGILPAPSGTTGGHAILAEGWDDSKGLLLRNSWGSLWGVGGDCFLPYPYLTHVFEGWKTLDAIEVAPAYPRTLKFAAGTYIGRKFSATGAITASKSYTLTKASSAPASRRSAIAGHPGFWFLITAGVWAGFWIPDGPGIS